MAAKKKTVTRKKTARKAPPRRHAPLAVVPDATPAPVQAPPEAQHLVVTITMRECENIEITGAKNVEVSDGGYYVHIVSPGTF